MNPTSTETSLPRYVVGFLFNNDRTGLALIQKLRPNWQAGFLNGVGGRVENDELPEQTMARESLEEFGVTPPKWSHFATLQTSHEGEERIVYYFYAAHTETMRDITQPTDELPVKIYVNDLNQQLTIPNVKWLVPMALSITRDRTNSFLILEQAKV
jgi:8-oxo-dGTP pyrophosphatase MutT (NUDIX family)